MLRPQLLVQLLTVYRRATVNSLRDRLNSLVNVGTLLAGGGVALALALLWRRLAARHEPPGPPAVPLLGTLGVGECVSLFPNEL